MVLRTLRIKQITAKKTLLNFLQYYIEQPQPLDLTGIYIVLRFLEVGLTEDQRQQLFSDIPELQSAYELMKPYLAELDINVVDVSPLVKWLQQLGTKGISSMQASKLKKELLEIYEGIATQLAKKRFANEYMDVFVPVGVPESTLFALEALYKAANSVLAEYLLWALGDDQTVGVIYIKVIETFLAEWKKIWVLTTFYQFFHHFIKEKWKFVFPIEAFPSFSFMKAYLENTNKVVTFSNSSRPQDTILNVYYSFFSDKTLFKEILKEFSTSNFEKLVLERLKKMFLSINRYNRTQPFIEDVKELILNIYPPAVEIIPKITEELHKRVKKTAKINFNERQINDMINVLTTVCNKYMGKIRNEIEKKADSLWKNVEKNLNLIYNLKKAKHFEYQMPTLNELLQKINNIDLIKIIDQSMPKRRCKQLSIKSSKIMYKLLKNLSDNPFAFFYELIISENIFERPHWKLKPLAPELSKKMPQKFLVKMISEFDMVYSVLLDTITNIVAKILEYRLNKIKTLLIKNDMLVTVVEDESSEQNAKILLLTQESTENLAKRDKLATIFHPDLYIINEDINKMETIIGINLGDLIGRGSSLSDVLIATALIQAGKETWNPVSSVIKDILTEIQPHTIGNFDVCPNAFRSTIYDFWFA